MTKIETIKILFMQQGIEFYNLDAFLKFLCGLASVNYYFTYSF